MPSQTNVIFHCAAAALLLLLSACSSSRRQTIPEIPAVRAESFFPDSRRQIEEAYQALLQSPEDRERNGNLGMLLQAYDQNEGALACYRRAGSFDPNSFSWPYYEGVVLQRLARNADAVSAFRRSLSLKPDHLATRHRLAEALLESGAAVESRRVYEELVKANPRDAAAHYGLGRVLSSSDPEAAVGQFRKAVEIFPQYGVAHFALAQAYTRLGRSADAERHFHIHARTAGFKPPQGDFLMGAVQRLQIGPYVPLRRGRQMLRLGRLQAARREFEQAARIDPKNANAHVSLSSVYLQLGQVEKASEHLRIAAAEAPDLPGLSTLRGRIALRQEHYQEAADSFQAAIRQNPQQPDAYAGLAGALEKQGDSAEAAQAYRRALEHHPVHLDALAGLGRSLLAEGKLSEAIEHMAKAAGNPAAQPELLHDLAVACRKAGDFKKAQHYARLGLGRALAAGSEPLIARLRTELRASR